jgi:GT2 family glycosyltransferase
MAYRENGTDGLQRPFTEGKFVYLDGKALWVRGVTYGTFDPALAGDGYPGPATVERDFASMAAAGFNAVRTYTTPPARILDAASTHGLRLLVGLPWEEHIAFLGDPGRARDIRRRLARSVRGCARHPAVLGYAIGNEIPAPIVRWHGARRVEKFLAELADVTRQGDPHALVTYVNFPSTEYLELPFADLVCFNVYLESPERLQAYLARLHNVAGERPVLLTEIGLDSRRNGVLGQARLIEQQVRGAFAAGCAGVFVFAWTDEWHRGGHAIEDWDFGLTDRRRHPKPGLAALQRAFEEVPFPKSTTWPSISVVVCSYNGSRTIGECLEGVLNLDYPDFEVIVVDDGSTDNTAAIAQKFGVRLIRTPNRGLSSARNTGMAAARGEIVAYTDDDAYPDPHWLTYLAAAFARTDHVAVGGPNIPPPDDPPLAHCVANAPGGPTHVLLSDTEAEHIPGCNMAFRKWALEAIDGFDPRFRTAGDDVDVCWRLRERGWTLGFSAAALVWHHRRGSVRTYWRQQRGYGKAEALLEQKWPEKYNALGHTSWAGRLYGGGLPVLGWRPSRIYHGTWGSALFQSLYEPAPSVLAALASMPEWYLVIAALAGLAALGALWPVLLMALPLLGLAVALPLATAVAGARQARLPGGMSKMEALRYRFITGLLFLFQPLARLRGRLGHGLAPWRVRVTGDRAVPSPSTCTIWTETWEAPQTRLAFLEDCLRDVGWPVSRGGAFDRWDLAVSGGLLGGARLQMVVEEHGGGRQLARLRAWPHCVPAALASVLCLSVLAACAAASGRVTVTMILGGAAVTVAVWMADECGRAMSGFRQAWRALAARAPKAVTLEEEAAA